MNELYKAIDYYFQQETNAENIPEILLKKENEFLVKNIAVRYFKDPRFWVEVQKLNQNFIIYSMKADKVLKYCKYIGIKYGLNPYNDKMYIKRINIKQPYNEKLFKEFSEYIDKKTNYRYSQKDKEFMYTTLLTDEEKIQLTPSLAKKAEKLRGKKKVKDIINEVMNEPRTNDEVEFFIDKKSEKSTKKLKESEIIFFVNNDAKDTYKEIVSLFKGIKYSVVPISEEIFTDDVIKMISSINPKLIVGIGKDTFNLLNDKISNNSMKFYTWKYNEYIPVIGLPSKHKEIEKFVENIIEFLKKSNVAKAQINENAIDMSTSISSLEEVYSWDELFNKYLKDGWKIYTTQYFNNQYEFKNPLALMAIINTETQEVKYINCNKLDYVYYVSKKKPEEGIEPIEPLETLERKTISFYDYATKKSYEKFPGLKLPQLFEADLRIDDKLMSYSKEYAKNIGFENPNDVICINPKVAYIDIEVYMDEGFEQPETARKEINAIAYSVGDSTHVDIYVLDKTGKYTEDQLNNSKKIKEMFENAKKSVVEASKSKKGMENVIERISKYTYSVKLVKTEHELLQCLERRIREDEPQILTSWNAWFDFNYIINRAKLMRYDDITLSPIGIRGYISSQTGLYCPVGSDVIDSLEAYAGTVRGALKSNKLGYIGLLELGLNKIEYDGELYELYDRDLETFTGYNNFDVVIFKEIDLKKQVLKQKMVYRQVTGCSTGSIDSTIRSSDTISIEYARKQGKAIRNHTRMISKEGEYIGAINAARKIGVHYLVADLDQTSQYPSMMRTFNISPNTLLLKIDAPYETLYRFIHENYISEQDYNKQVKVIFKPLVWFGGDKLGIETYEKLGDVLNLVKQKGYILTLTGAVFKNHKQEIGFYYTLLTDFKNKRDYTKSLMKKAHKEGNYVMKEVYNNEQLTWKVLQNALYGATGTDSFRFFHIAIASTITTQARTEISIVAYNLDQFIKEWEKRLWKRNKVA